jgi:hypothetical protein
MRPSVVALAIVVAACGPAFTATPSPSAAAFHPGPEAKEMRGGCGTTDVYHSMVPEAVDRAAGNNAPRDLNYTISDPPIAAGFIFDYPLKATTPTKILWVVAVPRAGAELEIEAHPQNATAPVVRASSPANSAPGEIYPSSFTIPTPGCWAFTLRWATNRASVDLLFD